MPCYYSTIIIIYSYNFQLFFILFFLHGLIRCISGCHPTGNGVFSGGNEQAEGGEDDRVSNGHRHETARHRQWPGEAFRALHRTVRSLPGLPLWGLLLAHDQGQGEPHGHGHLHGGRSSMDASKGLARAPCRGSDVRVRLARLPLWACIARHCFWPWMQDRGRNFQEVLLIPRPRSKWR